MAKQSVEITTNIILKIGDKEIKITEDEALKIYNVLKEKFDSNIVIYPNSPLPCMPSYPLYPIITYGPKLVSYHNGQYNE